MSYIECCKKVGAIVSAQVWIIHSKKYNHPHLRYINDSHFDKKGFRGMRTLAKSHLNLKYKENRKNLNN